MSGFVELGPDATRFNANLAFGRLWLGEGSPIRRVQIVDALDKLPKKSFSLANWSSAPLRA